MRDRHETNSSPAARRGTKRRLAIAGMALVLALAGCRSTALSVAELGLSDMTVEASHEYPIHGIDVAKYQGDIDWNAARQGGVAFAFLKATEGGDRLDDRFHENWREARAAGVPRGAYHFWYHCRPGIEQARWFIDNVPREKGALPPVIDVEWNHTSRCKKRPDPATVREKMQVFMDRLEAHYGQRPIIYTAPDFYDDNLKGAFKNYPFWLRSVAAHPSKVYPNRDFVFWQYSGTGLAASHDTRIDLNVFNGSEAGWHKWLASNRH